MIKHGTRSIDILADTEADDFVFGFAGNDTLISNFGSDTLFGGKGDDTFIIGPQGDGAVCYINGGGGDDLLYLAREPISIEIVRGIQIISYDYDMTIIVDNVETVIHG